MDKIRLLQAMAAMTTIAGGCLYMARFFGLI
jgi:hypothetical protein